MRERTTLPPVVHADPGALGQAVAEDIAARIEDAEGRDFLLGCPGGRSPVPVYGELSGIFAKRQTDLSRLRIVMMDDYVQDCRDGFEHVPGDAHYSCRRFARHDVQAVLNAGLPDGLGVPDRNVWFPDPADPGAYDDRLRDAGGIDFFILASGASDGHVAFNPPGSAADSRSRIVTLAAETQRDNLATFPDFAGIDDVPTHGVTVGIGTIATLSRAGAMVVWGNGKRQAFQRLAEAEGYDPDWPATVYRLIPGARLHADRAAAETSR